MDTPNPQKIRTLLTDPDAVLSTVICRALERLGSVVTITNDGADLVARFSPDLFDVVIVGIKSARLNGLQVLREIKRRNPETPVILLSDEQSLEAAATGMSEGAFAYLQTPLNDIGQLEYTVAHAFELKDLRYQVTTLREAWIPPSLQPANAPSARLLRELIESVRAKPLSATLQILAEISARLMETPYGVVLLGHPGVGLQVYSAYGFENIDAATRAFAENIGDTFAWRVTAERRALIGPVIGGAEETSSRRALGISLMAEDQALGILIVYPIPDPPVNAANIAWLETLAVQGVLAVEFARLRAENQQLLKNDPVTGVLKREFFLEIADREFRRSWRYDQPITAILVDVDDMSEINLKHGREFGDRVMSQVAEVCRSVVRSIDLIGRYEEDSLVLLLLMTESEDAKSVAERLRTGIDGIQLEDTRGPARITASLGICSYPRDGCTSIFDLLTVAQEAQRAARSKGTNQIAYG